MTFNVTDLSCDCYSTSNSSGSTATLQFQGESVEIYGKIGLLSSQLQASIDGGEAVTVDCFRPEARSSVLLWSINSLVDGPHTLTIKNQPSNPQRNELALDYAIVRSKTDHPILPGYV